MVDAMIHHLNFDFQNTNEKGGKKYMEFKINTKLFNKEMTLLKKEWNSLPDSHKKQCTFGTVPNETISELILIARQLADFFIDKDTLKAAKNGKDVDIAKDRIAQLCIELTEDSMEAIFLFSATQTRIKDIERSLVKGEVKELLKKLLK